MKIVLVKTHSPSRKMQRIQVAEKGLKQWLTSENGAG